MIDSPKSPAAALLQLLHYASLPAGAALFCLLVFMAGERKRGQLTLWALSGAVSLNTILKALFKVPRPWLMNAEAAPFSAEGGYAFPCLHVQLTAAVFSVFLLTSKRRSAKICSGLWIACTALVRLLCGLQSAADIAAGLALGLLWAAILLRFDTLKKTWIPGIFSAASGTVSAVFFRDPWGLGLFLAALALLLPDRGFARAEKGRTRFGILYGTGLAAGTFIGLYIFLPFLIEWLVTPLWPGQVLIVFLLTFLPCLYRLFPCF